jgi:sugar lactone lactonase YvrE
MFLRVTFVRRSIAVFAAASVLAFIATGMASGQATSHSLSNPYTTVIQNWGTMPEGRPWGSPGGVWVDRPGNVWVLERCGANSCAGRSEAPVLEFDASGRFLKSFGANMIVFPHGIFVDDKGNVWVSDADGKDGKGQQVFKFSPDGKVLMTLGKAGVTGEGPDTFNRPSAVLVSPNGDIFVADGHGGDSNARIVKFSKDGKFIKTWGKKGSGPGEFDSPHSLAMDSEGRLYVADRGNNRIQIFDQDGKFLDQWMQFGRPSGIFIDKKGILYVSDNSDTREPEWKKGIRVGRVKDGVVTAFIEDADQDPTHTMIGAENIAADANGNIYVSDVARMMVRKYVKP